ncbi:hypothetical protein GCM10023094_01120 [Rhodococcus olei]|uniref:Exopolysaccharide biosynthesis WecB/TagA/CpsF family protein n=1 Tax=Rhodococcus olei TaxID=2161675 RepID=A0ABP8NU06_9NOCA
MECRGCGSTATDRVLDLGRVPAADWFPLASTPVSPDEISHPLAMELCRVCGLAQLAEDDTTTQEPRGVEPQALKDQAADAVRLLDNAGWLRGDTAIEYGSPHGGSWLPLLADRGYRVPRPGTRASLVLDCFGIMHERDQRVAFQERARSTAGDGVLLLQFHSLMTIVGHGQWNALRHGHFAYYSLTALTRLLAESGMGVADAWEFPLYGGTVLVAASADRATVGSATVHRILRQENAFGVTDPTAVRRLQDAADRHAETLRGRLEAMAADGRHLYAYGAASRAVALFARAGIDRRLVAAVADASTAKWGRRMPGTDIPIVPPRQLVEADPDRVLVTVPDLLPELRRQYPERPDWWVVDLPGASPCASRRMPHTDTSSPHRPPWPRMVVDQVPVDLLDRESAIELIFDALTAAGSLAVASANLDHIHHFGADASWANRPPAVSRDGPIADMRWLTLLDGVPLVRKAKAETGRAWPKLSGSDLLDPILARSAADGVRVGFLGGSAAAHRRLHTALAERYPTLETVGAWAPERSELTDSAASVRLAHEIRGTRVEILVVSLGKPLQENWIAWYGLETGARVFLAFGAAVDFLAGRVRRAPQWVADAGLEWAWRLSREPRRLAHRYLVEAPPALVRLERRSRAIAAAPPESDRATTAHGRFVPPGRQAEVAVVVVTYNSEPDLPGLIAGLRVTAADHAIRVIVADNRSSDGTVRFIENQPDIELVGTGGNLGYAGGINAALPLAGPSTAVLILNPDIRLHRGAVTRLLAALGDPRVGAVVPLILDSDGTVYPSVRREPSLTRTVGDALFGGRIRRRPAALSEIDHVSSHYLRSHDIDWATGAAILVRSSLVRQVGDWNEEFFLYSEETDYFRRIRDAGHRVRFEPAAVVTHRGGGSGTSSDLATLMSVNRVRYAERFHGAPYSALFRGSVALAEMLRSYDADHRRTLAVLLRRNRWSDLPTASKSALDGHDSARRDRGAVIVPAYNEADVIERTLAPLSGAAAGGVIELVVVCNGCHDRTAEIARAVPGTTVLELDRGSKPAALDAGDEAATLWPRVYLDADIQISSAAVLQVLDRLSDGDVLAARPASRYDHRHASTLVRSYFRARERIPDFRATMWGAGVYGLTESGHQRVGLFSDHVADDLFVDAQFEADEKTVVSTLPSVVTTPTDAKSLLLILRRWHRGTLHEARALDRTGQGTARALLHTIRGPGSAADAVVYAGMALAARWNPGTSGPPAWERDASSRSGLIRPRRDSQP